jgi:glycosyltransferase involved in cell wall biosynthesis
MVAYCPDAIAYFRQHGRNTSVTGYVKPNYYSEHQRIAEELRRRWGTPDAVLFRHYLLLAEHYNHTNGKSHVGQLSGLYSNDHILRVTKEKKHVLVCMLGFHLGGGELFPIYLSNALLDEGYTVSCLCLDNDNENLQVREALDSRVAVYDAQYVREIGLPEFIKNTGVDVVHSHNVGVEYLFFRDLGFPAGLPYVVTLHGSYEVTAIADDIMFRILRGVSHWVYLSGKNLAHFSDLPISKAYLSSIPNGMPADERPFEKTRAELGIGESDVVFSIASRAIPEKGWDVAIRALELAQRSTEAKLHLILCGTGPEYDRLEPLHRENPYVHLLGFQERIHGIYKLSDVAILPSRFPGESYPLTLIQAMQVGRAIIATDIGEIKNMLGDNGCAAGITIEFTRNDTFFIRELAQAMIKLSDVQTRSEFAKNAELRGKAYSIANVAKQYSSLFEEVCARASTRFSLL